MYVFEDDGIHLALRAEIWSPISLISHFVIFITITPPAPFLNVDISTNQCYTDERAAKTQSILRHRESKDGFNF